MEEKEIGISPKAGFLVGALFILVLTVGISKGQAITWGDVDDGDEYPSVCMMGVSVDGVGQTICSGTLISPGVVLTAGHCIEAVWSLEQYFGAEHVLVEVFFDWNLSEANPGEGLEVDLCIAHPDYYWGPQSNPHDVGVLILSQDVEEIEPAQLPDEGKLEELRAQGELHKERNKAEFTTVGYGGTLQWPPPGISYDFLRKYAVSEYRALLPAWLRLSQNQATNDGGSCSGDSGGPVFWRDEATDKDILVGITSWGDPNCISSSFNYRVDIHDTLEFLNGFISNQP